MKKVVLLVILAIIIAVPAASGAREYSDFEFNVTAVSYNHIDYGKIISFWGTAPEEVKIKAFVDGELVSKMIPVQTKQKKKYSGSTELEETGWFSGKVSVSGTGSKELKLRFKVGAKAVYTEIQNIDLPSDDVLSIFGEARPGIHFSSESALKEGVNSFLIEGWFIRPDWKVQVFVDGEKHGVLIPMKTVEVSESAINEGNIKGKILFFEPGFYEIKVKVIDHDGVVALEKSQMHQITEFESYLLGAKCVDYETVKVKFYLYSSFLPIDLENDSIDLVLSKDDSVWEFNDLKISEGEGMYPYVFEINVPASEYNTVFTRNVFKVETFFHTFDGTFSLKHSMIFRDVVCDGLPMEIGFDPSYKAKKTALAGQPYVQKLKILHDGVLEEVKVNNNLDATQDEFYYFELAVDEHANAIIARADMSSDGEIVFKGIDYYCQDVTDLYLVSYVRPIDYSADPSADATATAGRKASFRIMEFKYSNQNSGMNYTVVPEEPVVSEVFVIAGEVLTSVFTDFQNSTLADGVKKVFFSIKVGSPDSSNIDYDGSPLANMLNWLKLNVVGSEFLVMRDFKINRTGGINGFVSALDSNGDSIPEMVLDGTRKILPISFFRSYGEMADRYINPGDTVEYNFSATIVGTSFGKYVEAYINNIGDDLNYVHNVGYSGVKTGESNPFFMDGSYDVAGGTLSR